MKTFKELGLNHDLMKSLEDLGFVEPSSIQVEAIPFLLKSKQDLVALAQTGTGKTAAFALPILQQIKADGHGLQAIILCPTRELCLQISQSIKEFAKHSKNIVVTPIYGGERIDIQIRALKRGTNIVVGTPGRVHDMVRRNVLKLQSIKYLVLDEADEMLDMGFKEDLDVILKQTPENRQSLLFSATMSKGVASIAKRYMKDAKEISIGDKNVGADMVSHEYYVVQSRDRFESLKRILDCLPDVYGILFCRTRRETQEIADKLRQANYDAEAIHGEVSQNIRTKIMDRFKKKQINLLVATDVAARGIDVKNLTHVINYNLPDQNTAYTHRSGRTGRAQQTGISIAIIGPRDTRRIKELEIIIGKPFQYKQVPKGEDVYQRQIDNFVDSIHNSDMKDVVSQKYLTEIIDRLKSTKKEDLIRYFVNKELTHLAKDQDNKQDLNAEVKNIPEKGREIKDGVNLKINIGKRERFDIKALFSLINSISSLRGMDIGRIDLRSEFSLFVVDKKYVTEVIKTMSGKKFRGKDLKITKDDAPNYSKNSYSKNRSIDRRNRNDRGKRSGFGKSRKRR